MIQRLVIEQRPRLVVLARRLCRDAAEADDLVQETMVRALERAPRLTDGRNVPGWLVTILCNLFRDRCRRARRRPFVDGLDETRIASPEPDPAPAWAGVTSEQLRAALAELDEDFRTVFEMFEVEGCSYEQIATRLGIRPATVGSRLSRAREKLLKALRRGREEAEG